MIGLKKQKKAGLLMIGLMLISLSGCHADPAKGSDEKWLSQIDSQSVIVGENYYMPDFDQDQIIIWNFSDQSMTEWDFCREAQLSSVEIIRITSPDSSRLAIWTQAEKEALGSDSKHSLTVNIWNLKEKRLEKQIITADAAQMRGTDLYWIEDNQLWHQSVDEEAAESVADLQAEVQGASHITVEAVLEQAVFVSADYYAPETARTYFKIDLNEKGVTSFVVKPDDWGEVSSVAYLLNADEEKLYFQIYGILKTYYFATDHEGQNAELIHAANELTMINVHPALSQEGFYTIMTNREISNFDEPRQCQIVRQKGYDKEIVAAIDCAGEMRCMPVGGWLKIKGYSGNGVNRVDLVHPQTGKVFNVAEAKSEICQSLEDQALQGIDQPITFINEEPEAKGSSKDPGEALTCSGTALEMNGNVVMISANGKLIQQLDPKTGGIEERFVLSAGRYPRGRIVRLQKHGGRLFIDISWQKEKGPTSTTLIVDPATFEVTNELNDVREYAVSQDYVVVALIKDWSMPEEYWRINLVTQEKEKLFDSTLLNPEEYNNVYVNSLAYDENNHCLWLTISSSREANLYQFDLNNKTMRLRARPEQIDTWSEQSFMLYPIVDDHFVLGLWQAEDMLGDNYDFYELNGNRAELFAKDLSDRGTFSLTEHGAFTAEMMAGDWSQPYQDVNSPTYWEYTTIYYRSGDQKEELLQLDSVYVQMAYLPSQQLWLRAQAEAGEYPQQTWITTLYDLNSGELRIVNEETFNIYE